MPAAARGCQDCRNSSGSLAMLRRCATPHPKVETAAIAPPQCPRCIAHKKGPVYSLVSCQQGRAESLLSTL